MTDKENRQRLKEPSTLAGKALVLTVANAIGTVANLITPFVLVRIFTKEDYGLLGMVFFLITSLHSLVGLNISNSAAFFIPRKEMEPRAVIGTIQGFNLLVGAFLLVGMVLAPGPVLWLFKSEGVESHILIVGLTLLVWNGSRAMSLAPIALGRSAVSAAYIAVTESIKNVFVLVPGLVYGTVESVLWGFLTWSVLRMLLVAGFFRFSVGVRMSDFDFGVLRRMLSYSLPFGVTTIIVYLFTKYHGFLMVHYADEETFAVYRAGTMQLPLVMLVLESAIQILTPEVARLQGEGDKEEIIRVCARAGVRLATLFLPMLAFLLIMAVEFITVCFTEAYLGSVAIFRVNLMELLIVLIILDPIIRAFEELKFLRLKLYSIGLLVLLVAGRPVIESHGAAGAVALTLGVYMINKLITFWWVRRTIGIDWKHMVHLSDLRHILRGCLFGAALALGIRAVVPAWLEGSLGWTNWWTALGTLAVSGLLFVGGFLLALEGGIGLGRLRALTGLKLGRS